MARWLSNIESRIIFGRQIFIKRDDLIQIGISKLSGNKSRKLFDFYANPHPATTIMSYGGAQSNSMLAISQLCASQKKTFVYFTNSIPKMLNEAPIGNYKLALDLGAKVVEVSREQYDVFASADKTNDIPTLSAELQRRIVDQNSDTLDTSLSQVCWVPQGGCCPAARTGLNQLAAELLSATQDPAAGDKPWKMFFASGTGTTALFVAQYLHRSPNIEVVAVPCAGSGEDLMLQMRALDRESGNLGVFPTVMGPVESKRRVFARPCSEHWSVWKALERHSEMRFDLLYAPRAFEILLQNAQQVQQQDQQLSTTAVPLEGDKGGWRGSALQDWLPDHNLLYYHCGGTEGNASQLARYEKMNYAK